MVLTEINANLFDLGNEYHFVQCISADLAMGAGIALEFNRRFGVRDALVRHFGYYTQWEKSPCIKYNNTLNLVTKKNYWHKPTYDSMLSALKKMREIVIQYKIRHIAMPKIGCGLDKLDWTTVKSLIKSQFDDLDVVIVVCVK